MPELPEVEIIKNNLSEYMIGNKFISIEVNTSKLRYKIPHNFDETIKNSKVIKIERIAKYIIIYLSNEFKILVHLGMTGNFLSSSQKINSLINNEDKHIHVRFFMTNDVIINYHDIRKFGFFKIISPDNLVLENLKNNLGIDALSDKFNTKYLINKLTTRTGNIKTSLLNQNIVAGIGNIYASEALYRARISPLTISKNLAEDEKKITKLISAIKYILDDAIKVGGSTIKNHKNIKGESGYFQYKFNVYNREKMKCKRVNCNSLISRINQSGRSTFYCKSCQK